MKVNRPPAVARVLETAAARELTEKYGHKPTVSAIRAAIEIMRKGSLSTSVEELAEQAGLALAKDNLSRLRPIWNLTGTVLHTNLGRAQLSENAIAAASAAMGRPVALEYDLEAGGRGERDDVVRDALVQLTGAQASVLTNNNAAALLLVLDTFGRGGEVIVSRGELIEIGGAFRLPELMEATGAKLREVGTTNRTHLRDYANAINENTRAIMKVHPSNFRIEGFTNVVSAAELAPLAREHGIPLINDMGSGTLSDLTEYGLPREQTVREAVAEGADIVTFSGDKLLGGPQAGFAVGRADLIGQMKRNPMKRALRLDKIRLAALEAVLRDYRAGRENPTQHFLARSAVDIAEGAAALAPRAAEVLGSSFNVEVIPCESQVGSGTTPTAVMPSHALAVRSKGTVTLDELAAAMRRLPEPVIGRIRDGAFLLDLRCLSRANEDAFVTNLQSLKLVEIDKAAP